MIIWGGAAFFQLLNTGGRYDPGTDSWTATSTTNAPDPRAFHTAIWTGSQMVVWGGFSPFGVGLDTNTGGRYNPGADSWTPTSTTNAPTGRENPTAVWTGSEMIVWGGFSYPDYFDTGGRYCAAAPSPTPGPGHRKCVVCHNVQHNPHTITIDCNALKAHLAHGDYEGPCRATPTP